MIFLFKTVFFIVSIVGIYNVISSNEINIDSTFKSVCDKILFITSEFLNLSYIS